MANLNEPGLELVVNDDVVAIALEAVPVVRHHGSDSLQRVHDAPGDVGEQLLRDRFTPRALQIQA